MNDFLRWLAGRVGVEVERGSELRLELSSFPSGGLGLVVILALLATLAIVYLAYARDARRLSRRRRLVLAALRTLAVLATFTLLLEPNLVAVKRTVRPGTTIVLVDTSQSMGHKDPYRRAPELAAGWRALGADPSSATRLELARSLLGQDDARLLTDLADDNHVFVYGFHSGLDPIAELAFRTSPEDEEVSAPPPDVDLAGLAANGRFSNLGGAVRTALERHRDSTIAALVILSDGRRNLGARGTEIARLVEQRKVARTVVLPIGDPSATQSLRLTRIDAPEKVFQKDPFTIRANVESQGYESVETTVRLERSTLDGSATETIDTRPVQLGADAREVLVEFAGLRSVEPGTFTYSVVVDPPEFEPPSPERHTQRTQIEVLAEQTRVLLVAGGPSHEYRFLRTQLIRDNTVSLSAWLSSADADFPQDGNVVLEALPTTREKLDEFDVFIFLDPDATKLDEEFCSLVASQVEENGAGLWWVCGEIYTLDAMRKSASTLPLTRILPVVPDVERADQRFGLGRARTQPLRYELTPEGALHKASRIADRAEDSARLWAALPGFYVAFPVERPKPAAVVIAEYVDPKNPHFGRIPVIATHFYGAGRVLYTGTDDTYRWRSVAEHAHNRFWIKGIRHLFEGRLTAGNARLRLTLAEEKLELGAPQHVVADAKDAAFDPLTAASFELLLDSVEGGTSEPLTLDAVEGVPGQYELRFWPTGNGFYRLRTDASFGSDVQVTFQVVPAEVEREGPANVAELGSIATAKGAVLCATPAEFVGNCESIESMSVVDTFLSQHAIWDSWFTIAWILALLAIEWWLRKRSNLL